LQAGIVVLLATHGSPMTSLRADEPAASSPQGIRRKLEEAKALIDAGKPSKARGVLVEAAGGLQEILERDRVPSGARALAEACQSLKGQLELEGIDVAGIEIPAFKQKPKTAGRPAAPKPDQANDAGAFPVPRPARPGGRQEVSFVGQIAPILVSRCGGCHVTGRKGDFRMESYDGLMKSKTVQSGVGNASRLVEVIESGDMPRGGGRVSPEELALLVRWIDAGARFDGADPTAGIDRLARLELFRIRCDAAEKLWRRVIPDEEPVKTIQGDVCLVANLSEPRAAQVAEACGKGMETSRAMLIGGDRPLVKGGVAIYAFAKPYDYSNFWQTVLSDERPKGLVGNAGLAGDVVYGAFVVPSAAAADDETSAADLTALSAEQIAAAALAARGAPEWFARGVGRRVAARAAPKSTLVRAWKQETSDALQRLGSPADFFSGQAGPVATAAIAGGFVGAIAVSDAKLRAVVAAIDAGSPFEKAFSEAFQSAPQPVFEAWAAKEARGSGSGRR
jgi:mono/diheme cytochrome c family protein